MNKNADFYFPAPRESKFCSQCAAPITRKVPPGDNQMRDLCESCGAVHYQNPRVVVGTVPVWEGKILMCLRAIEPRARTWTLPAGFMELGETTAQGALRETREEAGLEVNLGTLYTVIDVPHANQVHIYYLAQVPDPKLAPGPESLEARYYSQDEIPWDNLSFRSVSTTLEHYLKDQESGVFPTHFYSIDPSTS